VFVRPGPRVVVLASALLAYGARFVPEKPAPR